MERVTEEMARRRAKEAIDLIWHAGAYVIINVMLWFIDIATGEGINWAPWVTIFWGVGLAFHALAYFVDVRRLEDRMTQHILDEEETRSPTPH